jgi:hypothetical protein
MPRQCRSIKRAMRRGHYVNVYNGTYQSNKAVKAFREKLEAAARKAVEETQKDDNNE